MIFWAKFARKVFLVKNQKSEHHQWILHFQITLGTKFQLKLTFFIFLTRFDQKGFFWSKTEKVSNTYFLHNSGYSNSSSAKFQLNLTILILWTKFAQKRYFKSKTEKVNIIIEFCIFKLALVSNFSLNWKFDFLDQICTKKGIFSRKQKKWTSP